MGVQDTIRALVPADSALPARANASCQQQVHQAEKPSTTSGKRQENITSAPNN